MPLTWRRGISDQQIKTHDDRYVIWRDAPDSFLAFGPPGSQDIFAIMDNTARHVTELWQRECTAEDLEKRAHAGRDYLGLFTSPEEARKACEDHSAGI